MPVSTTSIWIWQVVRRSPTLPFSEVSVGEEQLAPVNRFGRAQYQAAIGQQRVMEQVDHVPLNIPLQIDHHVAADDQVEPRKRRVTQQIMRHKDHQLADFVADPKAAAFLDKKPLQPLRGDIRQDHADRFAIVPRSQRAKKVIDGCSLGAMRFHFRQSQMGVDRIEIASRRDDVNMPGLKRRVLSDLLDRKRRLERRQSARRRTNPHDRRASVLLGWQRIVRLVVNGDS